MYTFYFVKYEHHDSRSAAMCWPERERTNVFIWQINERIQLLKRELPTALFSLTPLLYSRSSNNATLCASHSQTRGIL